MTGMSRAWLWRQCRAGAIQHHRLGRHFSFSRDDLRDLMARTAVLFSTTDSCLWAGEGNPQQPDVDGMWMEPSHEEGPRPVSPLVRGLIGVVSGGGLEPPRPIKGTSTSS